LFFVYHHVSIFIILPNSSGFIFHSIVIIFKLHFLVHSPEFLVMAFGVTPLSQSRMNTIQLTRRHV